MLTADGEPPKADGSGSADGGEPWLPRLEDVAGEALSPAGLELIRSQEALGLEECESGDAPLSCFKVVGADEIQEQDAGGAISVDDAHVTAQVDAVLNEELVSDNLKVSQKTELWVGE